MKRRIAFFGPVSPARTGIAEYDEALLPHLTREFDIEVFLPEETRRPDAFFHAYFYSRHRQHPFDLVLYQMGNDSRFHSYLHGYLHHFPGAIVFHDYCLHHSIADNLLKKRMYREYREELTAVYPEEAEKIANAVISFAAGDSLFYQFPLYELLLKSSLAAAAHTDAAVRKLQTTDTPVVKIPHLKLPGRTEPDPSLVPGRFVLATFGFVTRAKRISPILHAMTKLRRFYPQILFVIVGEVQYPVDLAGEIERLRLGSHVKVVGRVGMTKFLSWMTRADVIANLRYPSGGEMSGTLIRSLTCGKPVLISRIPELGEIPEDVVVRIRTDRETEDVFQSVVSLLENEEYRSRLGKSASRYIENFHRPEQAVEKYAELIETAIDRKKSFRRPFHPDHLRPARELVSEYIRKTSFQGLETELLRRVLKSAGR